MPKCKALGVDVPKVAKRTDVRCGRGTRRCAANQLCYSLRDIANPNPANRGYAPNPRRGAHDVYPDDDPDYPDYDDDPDFFGPDLASFGDDGLHVHYGKNIKPLLDHLKIHEKYYRISADKINTSICTKKGITFDEDSLVFVDQTNTGIIGLVFCYLGHYANDDKIILFIDSICGNQDNLMKQLIRFIQQYEFHALCIESNELFPKFVNKKSKLYRDGAINMPFNMIYTNPFAAGENEHKALTFPKDSENDMDYLRELANDQPSSGDDPSSASPKPEKAHAPFFTLPTASRSGQVADNIEYKLMNAKNLNPLFKTFSDYPKLRNVNELKDVFGRFMAICPEQSSYLEPSFHAWGLMQDNCFGVVLFNNSKVEGGCIASIQGKSIFVTFVCGPEMELLTRITAICSSLHLESVFAYSNNAELLKNSFFRKNTGDYKDQYNIMWTPKLTALPSLVDYNSDETPSSPGVVPADASPAVAPAAPADASPAAPADASPAAPADASPAAPADARKPRKKKTRKASPLSRIGLRSGTNTLRGNRPRFRTKNPTKTPKKKTSPKKKPTMDIESPSDYQKKRLRKIKKNHIYLHSLGFGPPRSPLSPSPKAPSPSPAKPSKKHSPSPKTRSPAPQKRLLRSSTPQQRRLIQRDTVKINTNKKKGTQKTVQSLSPIEDVAPSPPRAAPSPPRAAPSPPRAAPSPPRPVRKSTRVKAVKPAAKSPVEPVRRVRKQVDPMEVDAPFTLKEWSQMPAEQRFNWAHRNPHNFK